MNGLQDDYSDSVTFVSLNAKDGADGETIFQILGLPGHPSIVIYTKNGEEVFRQYGIMDFDDLDNALLDILEN